MISARRFVIAALLAAGALCAPATAPAAAPLITPKVLQCDGSFTSGSITSHPTPTVRAEELSSNPGLKVGQRRLSILTATFALWRFDGNYAVTVSSCYTGGCTAGDSCKTWNWVYDDSASSVVQTGQCTYRDSLGTACANPMALYAGAAPNQAPVPTGAASCPTSTATLPSGSGNVAITATGPLPGLASSGLSANALQLNGSSHFGSAANSSAWNLPASYTLSAWIFANGGGRIVSQQGSPGYWGIRVSGGGLNHIDSRDASVGADVTRGSGLNGGWHLVHLVRRNGIDRRYFIDGQLVGTAVAASTNSFSSHPIGASLQIGRYDSGGAGSEFFDGLIDDVRVEHAALDDDAILLEYNTQIHKYSSNSGSTFNVAAGAYSGAPANGTTGAVTYIPGEAYTAASRWIFAAQSIDGESSFSSSYGVTIDNGPPIAPGVTAVATSPNDITWNWSLPPRVCLPPGSASVTYHLVNALTNSNLTPPGAMSHPTFTVGETVAGSANQLVGRKIRVTDTWGSGLSAPTSIYTLASPPSAASVVPSAVSTMSATISWNQNGNPGYTRYLVSMSQNPQFLTGVSTPATVASDLTGSSIALAGLSLGTTYFVRVQAISGRSGDPYGGTGSVFVSTSFTTLPGAPNLGGAAGVNQITWNWTAVPGAQYYKLFDVAGSTLYSGGNLSFPQTGLATNSQYSARVEAVGANGAGGRAAAAAFTLADDPTAPSVDEVHSGSITYSWNGGLNPAYTFYEVRVTTDVSFGVIVGTVTVNATTATVTGLLQGTTYYARVRSINGGQLYGAGFAVFATTRTIPDAMITSFLAPPSAYVPPSGVIGQWHFDESTGTLAADSGGPSNTAFLTCAAAACVSDSTPTFIAGPAGLGSAVSFKGLAGGLVRVPDAAQYAFTGSLSVSAWVNPSSLTQPNGAGIVVRGAGGGENFALEVSGGLWRFVPRPGFVAASTNTISVSNWTHLIGVYDSGAASASLYVNGRPASTVPIGVARLAAAHDISIGNRQSGSAAYDRGFLGAIDAVRVQNRALSAAEALAEFEGSFVSTAAPPSPNGAILIGLAPNAFGAPATISVSVNPRTNPITITPAVLDAGLTVIPTGFTLVPNSLVEIVPIVAGSPFTQTLGSSASVSMPYADAGGDNIIDGSSPPMAASAIKVYTLNTTINRWEALESYVDPAARRVIFFTPHFSVFAMFAPSTIGVSLSEARAYPIPWKPGSGGRFDAAGVTFDRLPVSGSIRILSLAGERVREFTFDGSSTGSIVWNGLTDWGKRAASGVYFARITGSDGSTAMVKLAIER